MRGGEGRERGCPAARQTADNRRVPDAPPPPDSPTAPARAPAPSYFAATERPIAAAAFVLPLIAFYEWGTRAWATDPTGGGERRIVAFNLVRRGFDLIGGIAGTDRGRFADALGPWLPAMAVVAALVGAHLVRRDRWRVRPAHAAGMLAESVLLAVPLLAVGVLMTTAARTPAVAGAIGDLGALAGRVPGITLSAADGTAGGANAGSGVAAVRWPSLLVLSVGAGVYEELVFRLVGFAALHLVLADVLRLRPGVAGALTVGVSAVAFAGYHHVGFAGAEPFDAGAFAFRTAAGLWFGSVYAARGFGLAAGCHAAYDALVVGLAALHAHA